MKLFAVSAQREVYSRWVLVPISGGCGSRMSGCGSFVATKLYNISSLIRALLYVSRRSITLVHVHSNRDSVNQLQHY